MDRKLLTENGWKTIALKSKVKDNGLGKALAAYEHLEETKHDERLQRIAVIGQLAVALKKAKEVAPLAEVAKYLSSLITAAEAEKSELNKAKAQAAKQAAAAAKAADEVKQKAKDQEEDEGEESGEGFAKLTSALKSLRTAKQPYFFLVCEAKPYGLVVSRKDIKSSGQAKKELAEMAGGSTRPPKFGQCHFDNGKLVFDMDKPPSGLARILQKWIKDNTGLGLKVMIGTESGDAEEQPATESTEPGKAASGRAAVGPAAPPTGVAKEKAVKLAKAAEMWHETRKVVDGKVNELKKAIQAHYAKGHPDLLKEIDKGLAKLDGLLDKLDHRLAESLQKAAAADNEAACQTELKNTKAIIVEYLAYVKSEPLIAHMDSNPFGVKTDLKQTLVGAVTHAVQSIA